MLECKSNSIEDELRIPIYFNTETKQISVGEWVAEEVYYNQPMRERSTQLKMNIISANGIDVFSDNEDGSGWKRHYKEISFHLGANFYAQLRKVTNDCVIDPIRHYLTAYCLYSKSQHRAEYHPRQILRVWTMKEHIEWMESHEMSHLVPLVIYFALPPMELKKKLGGELWKLLKNTSKSKVQCLTFNLLALDGIDLLEWEPCISIGSEAPRRARVSPLPDYEFEFRRSRLTLWIKLKSITLKNYVKRLLLDSALAYNCDHEPGDQTPPDDETDVYTYIQKEDRALAWLDKYGTPSNGEKYKYCRDLLGDTMRMSARLGRKFEYCNLRQMKARHNTFAAEIRKQELELRIKNKEKYAKQFDGISPYVELVPLLGSKELLIRVLKTGAEIIDESVEMAHCVSDYIHRCERLEMIVVSLSSSKQRTTLGLVRDAPNLPYSIFQHYGYDNTFVHCPLIQSKEREIVREVNDIIPL